MTQKQFNIPNISCAHCTSAVERELGELDGVSAVTGNVEKKQVTVEWDSPASEAEIVATLKEIGYPAAEQA